MSSALCACHCWHLLTDVFYSDESAYLTMFCFLSVFTICVICVCVFVICVCVDACIPFVCFVFVFAVLLCGRFVQSAQSVYVFAVLLRFYKLSMGCLRFCRVLWTLCAVNMECL